MEPILALVMLPPPQPRVAVDAVVSEEGPWQRKHLGEWRLLAALPVHVEEIDCGRALGENATVADAVVDEGEACCCVVYLNPVMEAE